MGVAAEAGRRPAAVGWCCSRRRSPPLPPPAAAAVVVETGATEEDLGESADELGGVVRAEEGPGKVAVVASLGAESADWAKPGVEPTGAGAAAEPAEGRRGPAGPASAGCGGGGHGNAWTREPIPALSAEKATRQRQSPPQGEAVLSRAETPPWSSPPSGFLSSTPLKRWSSPRSGTGHERSSCPPRCPSVRNDWTGTLTKKKKKF